MSAASFVGQVSLQVVGSKTCTRWWRPAESWEDQLVAVLYAIDLAVEMTTCTQFFITPHNLNVACVSFSDQYLRQGVRENSRNYPYLLSIVLHRKKGT